MRLKYYLRGLGVGIILTVIIFLATGAGKKETLTDAEIMERGVALGMIMPEDAAADEEETLDGSETDENQQEDNQLVENQADGNEIQDAPQEGAAQEQQQADNEQEQQETDTTKTQSVAIEVASGEYSDAISMKLMETGLVPDAVAFNEYLIETGTDNLIAVGTHEIPQGATYEEIAEILCESP